MIRVQTLLMVFVTLETAHITSKKEPITLGYEHDDPKKHVFSPYMKALGGLAEYIFSPVNSVGHLTNITLPRRGDPEHILTRQNTCARFVYEAG